MNFGKKIKDKVKKASTDSKREREINKKIKQAATDKKIKSEKLKLSKLGLSAGDAQFMAEKNVKKAEKKAKADDFMNLLGGTSTQRKPSKRKTAKKKGSGNKTKSVSKKKDPLALDIDWDKII